MFISEIRFYNALNKCLQYFYNTFYSIICMIKRGFNSYNRY